MNQKRQHTKPKVSSRKLKFEIGEGSLQGLIGLSQSDEGKVLGVFPARDGVTFGRSLGYGEYEGKGLPEWKNDRQLFVELNIDFVVRVTCDREGTTYLEIHQAGHQSFYSFPFKGIEYKDLFSIVPDFKQRLGRFLIYYGIYPLFSALYREKTDSTERGEAYNKITAHFESYFKNILKPKREREVETINRDGLTITSYERIESGRNLGSKGSRRLSEREKQRKSEQLQKIKAAIRTAGNNNENKAELARIIGITAPTLRAWLKSNDVISNKRFYDLIREVESH